MKNSNPDYKIDVNCYFIRLMKYDQDYYYPIETIGLCHFISKNSIIKEEIVFNKTPISDSIPNIESIIDDSFKKMHQEYENYYNAEDKSAGSKTVSIIKNKLETLMIFK